MRTTMNLPKALLGEAKRVSGAKTNTGAVVFSLQKLIDSKKIEKLRSLRGVLRLDVDLSRLRRDLESAITDRIWTFGDLVRTV